MSLSSHTQSHSEFSLNDSLRKLFTGRLSEFPRTQINNSKLMRAAVVFAILNGDSESEASFLLMRRPKHLKRHGGQYALPGGRIELHETAVEASLRELDEEIGIKVSSRDVIGLLDDYETRSGFQITPVIVWAGVRKRLNPDPNEVATVFRIPLSDLGAPNIPYLEKSADGNEPVLSIPIKTIGHRVYAPTAAIIYQFREVAIFDRHTRVSHFDQPKFAWS